MVQPAENISRSYPAIRWQLMWLNSPSPNWFSTDSLASVFHRKPPASIGRKNPESIQAADGPFARQIGIGAAVTRRPLPHHRAYGSVHGGSSGLR